MANVRGRALLARTRFVEHRCGPGGWQRVLEELPAPARQILAKVEPMGWYPMEIYSSLQDRVAHLCGGPKDAVLEDLGAYSADLNAEALFGKLAGDAFEFFKHISKLHRDLFDFGEMTVVRRPGGCLIEVDYVGQASASVCRSGAGFYRRCAELNGARNVQVEIVECQAHGDDSCLFKLTWKRIRRGTITSPPKSGS
jgi:predicted hydrocarbon binding protein